MNGNVLKYKGYTTIIEYSVEDKVLHGKIEGIDDLVDFCSDSVNDIENEFHIAVDDYLDFCQKIGKAPDKVYSGTFNVRINPELHKQISIQAIHNHRSLNAEVEEAIYFYMHQNITNNVFILPNDNTSFNASKSLVYNYKLNEQWLGGDIYGQYFQGASKLEAARF